MTNESQAHYGPYIVSFGEFFTKLVDAEYYYSLSKNEYRLLLKFCGTIDRSSYRANLSDIKTHKTETWAKACKVAKTHVSRSFRALKDLEIIDTVKVGVRHHHRLHPKFIDAIMGEMKMVERTKPVKKKKHSYQTGQLSKTPADTSQNVISVDNFDDSYQTGQLTVTKPGNKELPNRVTDSYQTGQLASNIEDFPTDISLSTFTPRSIPPDPQPVDNGDIFTEQETRLAGHYHDCDKLASSRAFIAKLKAPQLKRLDSFLDFLDHVPDWTMSIQGMNLTWAKWDLKQMERPNPPPKPSEAQEPNLSA